MKKLRLISLFALWAYGAAMVFAPSLHLLAGHDHGTHACAATDSASLTEFCGGEQNPCSRPEHDHAQNGHKPHPCVLCKTPPPACDAFNAAARIAAAKFGSDVFPLPSFQPFDKRILSAEFSRAPPVSLS